VVAERRVVPPHGVERFGDAQDMACLPVQLERVLRVLERTVASVAPLEHPGQRQVGLGPPDMAGKVGEDIQRAVIVALGLVVAAQPGAAMPRP